MKRTAYSLLQPEVTGVTSFFVWVHRGENMVTHFATCVDVQAHHYSLDTVQGLIPQPHLIKAEPCS